VTDNFADQLVSDVKADFEKRRNDRRTLEQQWNLNMNFLYGNQYCDIAPDGDISEDENHYYWQNRNVFNHIAPIIETRIAKLSRVRPTMSVRAAGGEEADLKTARISSDVLNATCNRVELDTVVSKGTLIAETYGTAFFEFTALKDKQEITKLNRNEKKQIAWLDYYIPAEHKEDWFNRREKNFNANKYLVDLVKSGAIEYFLIGCDDNAKFSQTHLESRHLEQYGKELGKTQFQVMSGADELGILMLSRAINKDLNEIPFVTTFYNAGKGGDTIPNYSNEKISVDIESAIFAAGGLPIPVADRADFVVAVNTNFDGKTFEAMSEKNNLTPRKGTKTFMKILNDLTEKNLPVGIADIAMANGADNALMEQIKNQNLQFKIKSYSGWNTPTNSSGFLIGAGVLTKFLTEHEKNSLLLTRYFDDWAYQANIRPILPAEINSATKLKAEELLKNFAEKNFVLPSGTTLKNISANFTWNRLFETDISFDY